MSFAECLLLLFALKTVLLASHSLSREVTTELSAIRLSLGQLALGFFCSISKNSEVFLSLLVLRTEGSKPPISFFERRGQDDHLLLGFLQRTAEVLFLLFRPVPDSAEFILFGLN